MHRRIDPRRVKKLRTYTIEEAAGLLSVHKNTIRAWMKAGLEPLDQRRPTLFVGGVLADFIRRCRDQARRPCPPGHFYCLKCKVARRPAGGLVEFQAPNGSTNRNAQALCCECLTLMNRRMCEHEITEICRMAGPASAGAAAAKEVDLTPLEL